MLLKHPAAVFVCLISACLQTACFGQEEPSARALKQEDKVVLCHIPPGNPENPKTLEVAASAVHAHLDHGDSLGPCQSTNECQEKTYSVTSFARYNALMLPWMPEESVNWVVSYSSAITTLEFTLPYASDADLEALDALVASIESLETDISSHRADLLVIPNLLQFAGACGNSGNATLTLPRTAQIVCIGEGETPCRASLCPLGSDYSLDPSDVSAVSFAPGNAAVLFGSNRDCTIVKPSFWDEEWEPVPDDPANDLLYYLDFDGDGASNVVESYGAGFIPSLYADLKPTGGEPFVFQGGSDPLNPDTDGDLLLDSYELLFGPDPLTANSLSTDEDGDGLNLISEQIYKTNPVSADTDGDGVSDFDEIQQGTDPLDDLSFLQAVAGVRHLRKGRSLQTDCSAETTIDLTLSVGDPSGSRSERYTIQVGAVEHQATQFGVISNGIYPFVEGNYTVTVRHRDSNLETPDYDYCASIRWPTSDCWEVTLSDPSRLLGCWYTSVSDRTIGLSATLSIKKRVECSAYNSCTECLQSGEDCDWKIDRKACVEDKRSGRNKTKRNPATYCPCEKCKRWYDQESQDRKWIDSLPMCPCNVDEISVIRQGKYVNTPTKSLVVPGESIWSQDRNCNPNVADCAPYHPGAYGCIRASDGVTFALAGQQCCYDNKKKLIPTGEAAGTPDRTEGSVFGFVFGAAQHLPEDVWPFEWCCMECEDKANYCPYYIGGKIESTGKEVDGAREDTRDDSICE